MHIVNLLFSFHGRINRTQYWVGNLAVWAAMFLSSVVVGVSAATSVLAGDPAAALSASTSSLGLTSILNLLTCWCALAIQVKRFHDRGRSGWFAAIPFVLVAWIVSAVFGWVFSQTSPEHLLSAIAIPSLLLVVVCLAFFVDLGLLPGKAEPNRFGDPPGASPSTQFRPQGAPPAPSSFNSASSALEAAIAQRKTPNLSALGIAPNAAAPQRAPSPTLARPAAPASFGRRTTS